jgi:hypothetical protein
MSTELKDKFQLFLDKFHKIISGYPAVEKVKSSLEELKSDALLDNELTGHQKNAIMERCANYLHNNYGEQIKRTDTRSDYSKGLK